MLINLAKTKFTLILSKNLIMKTIYFVSIIFLFLFSSCGVERIYVSATYGSMKSYTEKPVFEKDYKDKKNEQSSEQSNEAKKNEEKNNSTEDDKNVENENENQATKSKGNKVYTYFSGNISNGQNYQNDTDFTTSFELYRSYAQKNINLYYGGGGSFGTYTFGLPYPNLIQTGEEQTFGSINLKSGVNVVTHTRLMEFRFVGLEMLYNYEFGDYQRKIATIPIVDSTIVLAQQSMLSLIFYSEYVFKFNPKGRITFGFYGGSVTRVDTSQNSEIETNFRGLNLSFTYHKYTIYYIREEGQKYMSSKKFGLVYRF